jgi:hypothetical protein
MERSRAAAAASAAAAELAHSKAEAQAREAAALAALRQQLEAERLSSHSVPAVEAVAEVVPGGERGSAVRILAHLLSPGWLLASKAAAVEVRTLCCPP